MDRHLSVVAAAFRVTGLVLGIPSIAAFVWFIGFWTKLHFIPGGPPSATSMGRDGMVGLLVTGARAVGSVMEVLAGLTAWVVGLLAAASAASTLFGLLLFYTGRGLGNQAVWARILGGLLALGLLACSILAMAFLRRGWVLLSLPPLGLSGYVLWVLARGFN